MPLFPVFVFPSTEPSYRYFRLHITADNGQAITLTEFQVMVDTTAYPTSDMTSNTTPSPLVASASSTTNSTLYPAWKVFDGLIDGSYWYTQDPASYPEYVQIDLGSGNDIAPTSFKVSIPTSGTTTSRTPKDFVLKASKTGSFTGEEDDLKTVTNATGWTLGETREYTI